jgi:peroxiredoxin
MRLSYSVILAICVLALLCGCRKNKDVHDTDNVAMDFRLDTLSHERFYLNQYRGKVVVLTFWSTWCTICKTEMIELKSFASAPEYKNVVIAAVCNDPENIDDVKTIVRVLDINYPVLLDKKANIFKKLKMSVVPTTIVIDQSGKISLTRQGYDANIKKQIKTSVENLLAVEKSSK